MANKWQKFEAKFVLASLFFKHLTKRLFTFWRKKPQLPLFIENFHRDGIAPITVDERVLMPSFQKCQVCSFCTFECEAVQTGRAPNNFEPKFLFLGFGRSGHESEYFLEEWVPCLQCDHCTTNCPTGAPIQKMGNMIIERRNRLPFR